MEINAHYVRLLIESCRRNEFTAAEALGFIRKAWGEDVVSQSTVYRLYSQFGGGIRVSLESADRSGRPRSSRTDENVEAVSALINENQHLTINEIAEILTLKTTENI